MGKINGELGTGRIARILSPAIGILLVIWAFSEDDIIGGGPGFGLTQQVMFGLGLTMMLAYFLPIAITSSLLLIFISTAFSLVLAEFVINALYGSRFYSSYQLNEQYLYELVPGSESEYIHLPVNGGAKVPSYVNSKGFRGEELQNNNETLRLVVFGDSFIYSEFSSLENTFTEQLEKQLAIGSGRKFEVINAGIGGYGPDQILIRLEKELDILKPDLVIVSIFSGNDFGDLVRNKLFKLQEDGSIIKNDFSISDDILEAVELSRNEPVIKKILRERYKRYFGGDDPQGAWLEKDPYKKIEMYLEQHLEEYEEYIVRGDNVVRELRSDPYTADISLTPGAASSQYKITLMSGVMANMKQLTSDKVYPLVTLIIPHPMDLTNGKHDSGAVNSATYTEYVPSRLSDTLQSIFDQQQIPTFNLFGPFLDNDPASLYFKGGDDHWNDKGQRVAAELVADYLLKTEPWNAQR